MRQGLQGHDETQSPAARAVPGRAQGSRAIGKASKYGRKQQETAWKNTEVDALYQLRDAGVRVPEPHGYYHGVLVMELVTDAEGFSAPRLGELELSAEQAREYHAFLVRQVVLMLCIGLIHGDLSAYNVLVGAEGPVVIDFPQVVSAAGNNAAAQHDPVLHVSVPDLQFTTLTALADWLDAHAA